MVILQQTSIFIAYYESEFYGKQDSQANSFMCLLKFKVVFFCFFFNLGLAQYCFRTVCKLKKWKHLKNSVQLVN